MVHVAVGEYNRRNRFVAKVLARKGHGGACGFFTGQYIDHNPAGVAFNQGYVGQIKTAQLVNAFGHFVQANLVVQAGLPPQAWVYRAGGVAFNEIEFVVIPNNFALIIFHLPSRFGNQTLAGIGVVGWV